MRNMAMIRHYKKLFIGGKWVEPANGETIEVRSPHDQSLVGHAAVASTKDIDLAVAAARKAFDEGPWPRMSPAERRGLSTRAKERTGIEIGVRGSWCAQR